MECSFLCCIALLALALALPMVSTELVMVYSISRHGARNVLPKNSTLGESQTTDNPSLLPEGQYQCWQVGEEYGLRYLYTPTCSNATTVNSTVGTSNTCLVGSGSVAAPLYGQVPSPFNAYNQLIRSSDLDRSLESAYSMLTGAFPPNSQLNALNEYLPTTHQQLIPVYADTDDLDDYLIRGYDKCTTYSNRLLAWFNTSEFQAMAAATASFRNGIQALDPTNPVLKDVKLQDWWNVYDAFDLWRNYNVSTPMPTVSDATFAQITALANWIETAKMASNLTTNLLGGPLLGDMLGYMGTAVRANGQGTYFKLLHISSHYNVQLGLLGALKVDQSPAAPNIAWLSEIPAFAAVMVFELHYDPSTGAYAVRLVYQNGNGAPYGVIPLPCSSSGSAAEALAGVGSCSVADFINLVAPLAMNDTATWCNACSYYGTTACSAVKLQAQVNALNATLNANAAAAVTGGSSGDGLTWKLVVACVVCTIGTLILCLAAFALLTNQRRRGTGLRGDARPEVLKPAPMPHMAV